MIIKENLRKYIIEQILILEQKEDLNENKKALISLGVLGMLGAFIAKGNAPIKTKNSSSVEQTLNNAYKQKTGNSLSQHQLDKIKQGEKLARKLTSKQVKSITEKEPGVGKAFYELFKFSNEEIKGARSNPENKDIPIASIEEINVDDIFIYTQRELDQYFQKETNRSILELEDGSNILDMSPEELNRQISDPTSEVVKVIAEEFLMSDLVQQKVTEAVVEAFLSNYEDTMEENLDVAEIKARHEPEMLRVKALKHWLKNNVKSQEALRTLKDIKRAGDGMSSQEEIDNWVDQYNSGEMPDEISGRFDD